jgi:hypothetical protein
MRDLYFNQIDEYADRKLKKAISAWKKVNLIKIRSSIRSSLFVKRPKKKKSEERIQDLILIRLGKKSSNNGKEIIILQSQNSLLGD